MGFFKAIGFWICVVGGTLLWYEAAALVTPLPTLSRLMQGLRDNGQVRMIFAISIAIVWLFATVGAWLYYHLNYEPRSGI